MINVHHNKTTMDEILENVEIIEGNTKHKILKTEQNIFSAYGGHPRDELNTSCVSNFVFEGYGDEDDDQLEELDNSNKKANEKLSLNVKYVVAVITYPIENPALFKFDCSNIELTYGKLLYLYTYAYQLMYKLEDEDVGAPTENIPGLLNRGKSEGRFGIWGHDISDLIYNGNSTLRFTHDTVICEFDVDS